MLTGLEEVADFRIIREWEKTTETGDRAEIKTLPESSGAWAKIDARSDLCSGQKCPQFERCFITRMHQGAAESDIIIVNHHLFFADLAVKDDDIAGIIPDYDAVIFDEAHEVEDVAGQYFGVQYQQLSVRGTAPRRRAHLARRGNSARRSSTASSTASSSSPDAFFSLFGATDGRTGFEGRTKHLLRTTRKRIAMCWMALELASLST